MFRALIDNLSASGNLNGGFSEKMSVFITLTWLQAKSKLSGKKNAVIRENFFGYKVSGYDYDALCFLFKEVFVSEDYFFKPSSEQPVIIDCGANIGMSVLYFKKLYPRSKIIAFEANPSAFRLLEKNVTENKLHSVVLHPVALYDRESEISFFTGDTSGSLIASLQKERGGDTEVKVLARKLSTYIKDLETIDLVKMDVEGAEINIVNDLAESHMLGKPKEYIVEYHHNISANADGLSAFLQKFESQGFSYNIKADYAAARSVQDVLIHFYRK